MNSEKHTPGPWLKAPFSVGTQLRYIGNSTYLAEDGKTPLMARGMVATVTETHRGYAAHVHDFGEGPETVDPMHGWNVVQFKTGFTRAVTAEPDVLARWEVI